MMNTKENNHQWNGDEYSDNSSLQEVWADTFFFNNYKFSGGESVLDIGCGNGKITKKIATKVPLGCVIGIDRSSSMVNKATKSYWELDNISFFEIDAADSQFYDKHQQEFNIVTSFSALHWVANQEAVLLGIHKALKDNGKFFIRLSSKGGDPIQEIADSLVKDNFYAQFFKDWEDPMHRYSVLEYTRLIENAGLKIVSIKDVENKDVLHGKIQLIRQVKSWLPHYHHLKQEDNKIAEKYVKDVADIYLKDHPISIKKEIILYDHYIEAIGEKN